LIEIGRESRLTKAARRAAEALGGMAAILLLVWLIRGLLTIQNYSFDLLLVGFAFVFLGRVFSTKTNSGVGRAASSFLWNLTLASIIVVILIWFLGWVASIQSSILPLSISSRIPDLVIAAIATGLGAYAASKLSPERRHATATRPAFLVREGDGPSTGETRLYAKHDTVGVPIKRSGQTIGCVLFGDISASFNTPMGAVSALLTGPVTTSGIPFNGDKIGDAQVMKMTGKTSEQLVGEARTDFMVAESNHTTHSIDLPFVHLRGDGLEEMTEIGPINVHKGLDGEHVQVGPVHIDADGKTSQHGIWTAKGSGDSYIRMEGGEVSAKWNGSSLAVEGHSMKLVVGSDSFSYSPIEVKTASPLHALRVTQDKTTLDTRKFTLNISGDRVVLRTEDKTTSTESKSLAGDLRTLLTETAKSQIKDVMEGVPIDLSEMLASTEEVLAKHG
jgi:hypothetical protein